MRICNLSPLLGPVSAAARTCAIGVVFLGGCAPVGDDVVVTEIASSGATAVEADVWADNWFALDVGAQRLIEDSVSIDTERSFNAESFRFNADYPIQLNFTLKDFRENDTGLEYIGQRNQQMGDGGFIAQFRDAASGETIAVSDSSWRCLVVHHAPADKACENETDPIAAGPCGFSAVDEPTQWKALTFDDSAWSNALEYQPSDVRPKGGYDGIDWDTRAKLIWSEDLEQDNTLLCRFTISGSP